MTKYPEKITPDEWNEILELPSVRAAWGLEGDVKGEHYASEEMADWIFGAKFDIDPALPEELYVILYESKGKLKTYPIVLVRSSYTERLEPLELEAPTLRTFQEDFKVTLSVRLRASSEEQALQKFMGNSIQHWETGANIKVEREEPTA